MEKSVSTITNKISGVIIPGHKYSVKIAENRSEIEEALKLRFDVFNIELGEGLDSSYKHMMDEDEYDAHCDHLLVVKNDTNEIVGTYRVQTSSQAENGNGFYTNSEFEVTGFPDKILDNVVEAGRACIHRDHRNGRVLYMLWKGLAKYLALSKKRYLFGCCSVTSQDVSEGEAIYSYLKENDHLHEKYDIKVQQEFSYDDTGHQFIGEVKIPQLFRLYLELGVKVCSKPALDRNFKTIDFLILLDLEDLSEQSRVLFLK